MWELAPPCFLFLSETSIPVSKRIHPGWLYSGFHFRFLICWEWHLSCGWIPDFFAVSVYTCVFYSCLSVLHQTPSILGRHYQLLRLASHTRMHHLHWNEWSSAFPRSGQVHQNCALRTQRCWEVNAGICDCHLDVKFEMNLIDSFVPQTVFSFSFLKCLYSPSSPTPSAKNGTG